MIYGFLSKHNDVEKSSFYSLKTVAKTHTAAFSLPLNPTSKTRLSSCSLFVFLALAALKEHTSPAELDPSLSASLWNFNSALTAKWVFLFLALLHDVILCLPPMFSGAAACSKKNERMKDTHPSFPLVFGGGGGGHPLVVCLLFF